MGLSLFVFANYENMLYIGYRLIKRLRILIKKRLIYAHTTKEYWI